MKYLLTIYDNESNMAGVTPGAVNTMMDGYRRFGEEITKNGAYVAGEALEPVSTATTVRVKNGDRMVTDGPFAETRSSSPASTCSSAATSTRRSRTPPRSR